MTIETLLYPVHENQQHEGALLAGELCSRENKHLIVQIFSESLPVPPMFAGNIGAAQIWAERMIEREYKLNDRACQLSEQMYKRGVSAEIKTNLGDGLLIDDVIGAHARYTDLVLMPHYAGAAAEQSFIKRLSHGVLFQSGRPLLVYGETPPDSLTFKSVVVAWDGQLSASRTVSAALPLLKSAGTVHVLCINSKENSDVNSEKEQPVSSGSGLELSAYLARHQLNVTLHNRDCDGEKTSSVIQTFASENDVDLIVMGAYGHSRLKERLFGGTTIEMLEQSQHSLLMVH